MSTSSTNTGIGQPAVAKFGRAPVVKPWLDAVVLRETDECIVFPFKKNKLGYGIFIATQGRKNRKRRRAHNYVCEKAHGQAPTRRHIAAHSCDNPSCVNKRHLRWATQKENSEDMVARGRAAKPMAKINPDVVQMLRQRVAAGEQQKAVAAEVGLSRATVSQIVTLKLWKDVA